MSPSPRPNMQLLTLPSAVKQRSREASITSYRSDDGLSNISVGSLLPHEDDGDFMGEERLVFHFMQLIYALVEKMACISNN